MSRLIVVVTGANSGIGLAVCKRLIEQLSLENPPDVEPQFDFSPDVKNAQEPFVTGQALTLIMACRNMKKATAARQELYQFLDSLSADRKKSGQDEYGERFRKNLRIDIEYLDLVFVSSIFQCAKALHVKYPYISHLICNAGTASFYGINWLVAIPHTLLHPVSAVTLPDYQLQSSGERSADGLGWLWQCNVFGHYVLYRSIQGLLSVYARESRTHQPARVLWMSSLEALHFYDPDDWQLLKTGHPYEATKYQTDLIGTQLDQQSLEEEQRTNSPSPIRHFVVHPGVAQTGLIDLVIYPFMRFFMLLAFYLARFLGSPHHVIHPYSAALSTVHVSLAPLHYLPTHKRYTKPLSYNDADSPSIMRCVSAISKVEWKPFTNEDENVPLPPIRFGSQCDAMGRLSVGLTRVKQWKEFEGESKVLIDRMEDLYQSFLAEESRGPEIETFQEMMN